MEFGFKYQRRQAACHPPSTSRCSPVTNDAELEARKAIACGLLVGFVARSAACFAGLVVKVPSLAIGPIHHLWQRMAYNVLMCR